MSRLSRLVVAGLTSMIAMSALLAPASAGRPPQDGQPPQDGPGTAELSRSDVAAWLDGLLPAALRQHDIAGAVVSVVRDGKVLYQRGFGAADVYAGRRVDPRRTMFRVGSVSKLFTATAVLQQVAAGRLDLDADVRRYLDFELRTRFDEPVTVRRLLTHEAGFQEATRDLFVRSAGALPSLRDYLIDAMPEQIFRPGTIPAYSNYGYALAGYLVQRASGMPFADYLEERILRPLGMRDTTPRQPLPGAFADRLSRGYQRGSGPEVPFELSGAAPAASISASAGDMARFMIAQLRRGTVHGHRIFGAETTRLLQSAAVDRFPGVSEMALGFVQQDRNGHRIIGHNGATRAFNSDLRLFPDDEVGIFVSFNSAGVDGAAMSLRSTVLDGFTDRYFPPRSQRPVPTTRTAAEHAALAEGDYEPSRRAGHGFLRAGYLAQSTVRANTDGTITISDLADPAGNPTVFREIGPFVWQEVGGKRRIGMSTSDGQVTGILLKPPVWLTPVPVWRATSWNLPVLGCVVAVLLLTVLGWPVIALARRRFGVRERDSGAHLMVRLLAVVALLALTGWLLLVLNILGGTPLPSGVDGWIRALQVLTVVGVLGAPAAVWHSVSLWRSRARRPARVWGVLLVLAFLGVGWVSVVYDLITVRLTY